ncbi:hypothetical protein IFR05_015477 [Cadophora sp. M221]|nr:hypothetical protein IFR05_015477 [Cadophora sp. M221]
MPMLAFGRIINGFSVSICSAQVPVYITEVAPPSKRGRLVACQQWAIAWGIHVMFYVSYRSSFIDGPAPFRAPWGLQMLPAVFLFCAMMFLPESPRWLAKKDRWEESIQVLTLVHAKGDQGSPFVANDMSEIREVVEFERSNSDFTYLELLKPHLINRTHIGVFTQIWSQLTNYITSIFTMAGLGSNVLLPSSIQFITNVVMTILVILFIDCWGRRPTMLVEAFFMALWLFHQRQSSRNLRHLTHPRAGTHLQSLINLHHFALAYFVPQAFENIRWKVYIFFGVFCVAMFIHIFFLFPETAQKPLEEVEEIFDDTTPGNIKYIGTPAWKTHVDIHTRRME